MNEEEKEEEDGPVEDFGSGGSDGSGASESDFEPGVGSSSAEDSRRVFRTKRRFQYRKRECFFKKNKITYIDFKDVDLLGRFVARSGKITAPRFTGTSKPYQRKLAKAIKRARYMALMPYVDTRN